MCRQKSRESCVLSDNWVLIDIHISIRQGSNVSMEYLVRFYHSLILRLNHNVYRTGTNVDTEQNKYLNPLQP